MQSFQLLSTLLLISAAARAQEALPAECTDDNCFQEVIYTAFQIGDSVQTADEFACQAQCKETDGCVLFSYLPHLLECRLFPATTLIGDVIPEVGCISGPVSCGCYTVGMRFNTGEIGDANRMLFEPVCSLEDCQQLCVDTPNCHYWSFRAEGELDGGCILYNGTWLVEDFSKQDHISGPRTCEGCFRSGLAYEPISKFPVAELEGVKSASACQCLCANNTDCAYFNYEPENCECTLLQYGCTRVPSNSVVSGPKFCDSCPCLDEDVLLP